MVNHCGRLTTIIHLGGFNLLQMTCFESGLGSGEGHLFAIPWRRGGGKLNKAYCVHLTRGWYTSWGQVHKSYRENSYSCIALTHTKSYREGGILQ